MFRVLTLASLVIGFSAGASLAATSLADLRSVCRADVKAYCANVARGDGKLQACIADNITSFSPECRAALDKARSERADISGE
ncbi:cysteine rich repeat-containing protein [Martelella sp. HB161492]|uniref:cysteine rich repeat-containing protein n=1 Tax=Martelella sp. HB161492 TaxID=2720726 RepID=UPI00159283D0|nr:cysteine rich repeat-containing protein [Martelella sp. HB161492]